MFVAVHLALFRLPGMNPMANVEAEIRARGETLASFAARIGVRSQDINNWKRRGIPRTKQAAVAEALGWSLDRLLTGESVAPDLTDQPQADQPQVDQPQTDQPQAGQPNSHARSAADTGATLAYPAIAGFAIRETGENDRSEPALWLPKQRLALQAGQVVMIEERRSPVAFPPDWLQRRELRQENLALYQAEGDAMAPLIRAGDILLIDLADSGPVEGGVFLLHAGQTLIIRRIDVDYDGAWILRADNLTRYPDRRVSPAAQGTQVNLVGRVYWRGGEITP
jgi:phage repressor protein C with HTH and peptisase S24 domain